MTARILRAAERTPAPWKNGGGVTSQVAACPDGSGPDGFAWRVSVAGIERSGPFSAFAGVERIFTVVDGAGVTLTADGTSRVLRTPYEPFVFSGDSVTDCELLGGPVTAFNVMVRRASSTARVRTVRGHASVRPAAGTQVLATVLEGTAALRGTSVRLGRLDAALFPGEDPGVGDTAGDFEVDGVLALVTFAGTDATDAG